jgi:Carboxylesterase family
MIMKLRVFTTFFSLIFHFTIIDAQPFTQKLYDWRIEKNIEYGIDTNYAGIATSLLLDLYKPVGDANLERPILVLVHGGAWLGGCKDDPNSGIVVIAKEMAQRGFVVASINYRLGWHKSGTAISNPYAPDGAGASLYAADSSEIIRAIYRGQQDVKAAIRWMKARTLIDSTCNAKVLVGGESAGGFLALATGFLDRPEEKPISCFSLPDAPTPTFNITNSYTLNCAIQVISPNGIALKRPDLGPVDGILNHNGQDANVLGVISFFGGIPSEGGANNWLKGPDTPAVYLYHQTCDGVVPFGAAKPFFIISQFCNLGFTPWHYNYPLVYGNGAIASVLEMDPSMISLEKDFEICPAFNTDFSLFECIRYGQNGSYHFISNPLLRAQKIADFFSPKLGGSLCQTLSSSAPLSKMNLSIAPNPFSNNLTINILDKNIGDATASFFDMGSRLAWKQRVVLIQGENQLNVPSSLPKGLYFFEVKNETGLWISKLLKE